MRILVTGITGFAGGHLAEALLAKGKAELFGASRSGQWPPHLQHLADRVVLRSCDLREPADVGSLLDEAQPDQVYHLAGYAQVGRSFQEVEAAWTANLTATRILYDAIVYSGRRPRILYISSGLIYGDPENPGEVCDESSLLRPASPYAASKAAADLASYQYTRAPGLNIVRVRPFNHIGPGQSSAYAVAHFAEQIAAIEQRQRPPILETGNLAPVRDITDVRDIVQAYLLLMDCGQTGAVYNATSGQTYSIQAVLERLLAQAKVKVEVRQQASLVRSNETLAVRGDATRLRRETGWSPRYSLDQTLADILEFWRQRL